MNTEALQLASVEHARLGVVGNLENLPTEHVTARLMALNAEAEAKLEVGDIATANGFSRSLSRKRHG